MERTLNMIQKSKKIILLGLASTLAVAYFNTSALAKENKTAEKNTTKSFQPSTAKDKLEAYVKFTPIPGLGTQFDLH